MVPRLLQTTSSGLTVPIEEGVDGVDSDSDVEVATAPGVFVVNASGVEVVSSAVEVACSVVAPSAPASTTSKVASTGIVTNTYDNCSVTTQN
jgi:hypothetical protein